MVELTNLAGAIIVACMGILFGLALNYLYHNLRVSSRGAKI